MAKFLSLAKSTEQFIDLAMAGGSQRPGLMQLSEILAGGHTATAWRGPMRSYQQAGSMPRERKATSPATMINHQILRNKTRNRYFLKYSENGTLKNKTGHGNNYLIQNDRPKNKTGNGNYYLFRIGCPGAIDTHKHNKTKKYSMNTHVLLQNLCTHFLVFLTLLQNGPSRKKLVPVFFT